MQLILDTSIIIEIERKNQEIIDKVEELKENYPAHPLISFITYSEFLEGIYEKSEKNQQKAKRFIELFEVIQTTKKTADNLVFLKKRYELPVPALLIAAQVMEISGTLVTKDKDFEQIKEIDKIIL